MVLETTQQKESQAIHLMDGHLHHHQLACANCGTPLVPRSGEAAIPCLYCGQRHKFLSPPRSTEMTQYQIGDAVAVKWGDHWWSAHIVESMKDGELWRVHFEGWAPIFDDIVDIDNIRTLDYVPSDSIVPPPLITPTLAVKRSSLLPAMGVVFALVAAVGFAMVWLMGDPLKSDGDARLERMNYGAIAGPISTQPIPSNRRIFKGQKFHVQWEGEWYLGTATYIDEQGKITIHYNGWGQEYDEIVPRNRLRIVE